MGGRVYEKFLLDPTMPRTGRAIGSVPHDFTSAVLSIEELTEKLMSGKPIDFPSRDFPPEEAPFIASPLAPKNLAITRGRTSRETAPLRPLRYHPAFDMSILIETRAPRLLTMPEFAIICKRYYKWVWGMVNERAGVPFIAQPKRNWQGYKKYWFALETAEEIAKLTKRQQIPYDVTDIGGVVGRLLVSDDGLPYLDFPQP